MDKHVIVGFLLILDFIPWCTSECSFPESWKASSWFTDYGYTTGINIKKYVSDNTITWDDTNDSLPPADVTCHSGVGDATTYSYLMSFDLLPSVMVCIQETLGTVGMLRRYNYLIYDESKTADYCLASFGEESLLEWHVKYPFQMVSSKTPFQVGYYEATYRELPGIELCQNDPLSKVHIIGGVLKMELCSDGPSLFERPLETDLLALDHLPGSVIDDDKYGEVILLADASSTTKPLFYCGRYRIDGDVIYLSLRVANQDAAECSVKRGYDASGDGYIAFTLSRIEEATTRQIPGSTGNTDSEMPATYPSTQPQNEVTYEISVTTSDPQKDSEETSLASTVMLDFVTEGTLSGSTIAKDAKQSSSSVQTTVGPDIKMETTKVTTQRVPDEYASAPTTKVPKVTTSAATTEYEVPKETTSVPSTEHKLPNETTAAFTTKHKVPKETTAAPTTEHEIHKVTTTAPTTEYKVPEVTTSTPNVFPKGQTVSSAADYVTKAQHFETSPVRTSQRTTATQKPAFSTGAKQTMGLPTFAGFQTTGVFATEQQGNPDFDATTEGKPKQEVPSPTPSGPCRPNPCLNGGICSENINNSFACTCMSTFTGERCEIDDFHIPPLLDESLLVAMTLALSLTSLLIIGTVAFILSHQNNQFRSTNPAPPVKDDNVQMRRPLRDGEIVYVLLSQPS